eukprot:3799429-Rhodomonas_salina.5
MLLQELLRESNPSMFQKAEEDELRKRKEKELAEEAKKKQVRGRARLRAVSYTHLRAHETEADL